MTNSDAAQFQVADALNHGCKFCAAIGIVPSSVLILPQLLNSSLENGTLTFLESDGLHYGVTAWHVIERLRQRNAADGPGSFVCATLKDGLYRIEDTFRRPSGALGSSKQPDVAIVRISEDFVSRLGKKFYSIQVETGHRPKPLLYGVAFGFPTKEKRDIAEGPGYRVAMGCAMALAEDVGSGRQFLSAVSNVPMVDHLSGMSGGPVFWSTADRFGLLGIVYEGSATNADDGLMPAPKVHFFVDRCDHAEFSGWVEELGLKTSQPASIRLMPIS